MKSAVASPLVGALMLTLSSSLTQAAFISGTKLSEYCEAEEGTFSRGVCAGYVVGTYDSTTSGFCPPQGMAVRQALAVTTKYLKEHPERLHLDGANLVYDALSEAFPCDNR